MIVLLLAAALASPAPAFDEGFSLPSGRLQCEYSADAAGGPELRCDVLNPTYRPPARPADCPLVWGDAHAVASTGRAGWVCHGDTVVTASRPVLAYGRSWARGGITCTSSASGVRCLNTQGRGFELARARYRLF